MKKLLIISILLLSPSLSFAETFNINLVIGKSQLKPGTTTTAGTPTLDKKDNSMGIGIILGIPIKNTFLELGYNDFGSYKIKEKHGDAIISKFGTTHDFTKSSIRVKPFFLVSAPTISTM